MSSFQRRLDILDLIPRQPRKVTTNELLQRLIQVGHDNISLRTVQRDVEGMEKQGLFGLDVDKRSKPYGWYISSTWKKLNISLMDANTALAFSTLEQLADSLLPESTLNDLAVYFDKAKTILSNEETPLISQWKNSVMMISNSLPITLPEVDKTTQKNIKHALFHKKQLTANLKRFLKKYQTPIWKEYNHINPLGLIYSDGMPILLCTFGSLHQNYYTFPLSFIKDVVVEKSNLIVPESFDFQKITEKYQNNSQKKQDIALKIKARKDCYFILREGQLSHDQVIKECSDNHFVEITATVKDSPQLKAFLRGLGHGVEILEPLHLRAYFKDVAKQLNGMYQD